MSFIYQSNIKKQEFERIVDALKEAPSNTVLGRIWKSISPNLRSNEKIAKNAFNQLFLRAKLMQGLSSSQITSPSESCVCYEDRREVSLEERDFRQPDVNSRSMPLTLDAILHLARLHS